MQIAPYFEKCLSAQDLDEMNIEIIRNTLYKAYLEDFYAYCINLGGPTGEVMGDILKVFCNSLRGFFLALVYSHTLDDSLKRTAESLTLLSTLSTRSSQRMTA